MRHNGKGAGKALQKDIKRGLNDELSRARDSQTIDEKVGSAPEIVRALHEKYRLPIDTISTLYLAEGSNSAGILEELTTLTETDEGQVGADVLRLYIELGWPLEVLVPAVIKYGTVDAEFLIRTSGLSSSDVAQIVYKLKLENERGAGKRGGNRYPFFDRLPPLQGLNNQQLLMDLGYGAYRDNVTGGIPNSSHSLDEMVKLNEQAQR